jgi:hypothetical protein
MEERQELIKRLEIAIAKRGMDQAQPLLDDMADFVFRLGLVVQAAWDTITEAFGPVFKLCAELVEPEESDAQDPWDQFGDVAAHRLMIYEEEQILAQEQGHAHHQSR